MWFLYRLIVSMVCFLAAFLSACFMYVRFSQNRYLTGKEIPADKKAQVKQRYILTPLLLLGFAIYMGFFWKAPENKEYSNAQIERLITSTDNNEVKNYIILFINNRPRMKDNISAIQSIDANFYKLHKDDLTAENYGWTKEICLMVKLKQQTNLPGRWQIANGQTLFYYLGGGSNAGVFALKDVSQYFADMPIDKDEGTFISMPELRGIENIYLAETKTEIQ